MKMRMLVFLLRHYFLPLVLAIIYLSTRGYFTPIIGQFIASWGTFRTYFDNRLKVIFYLLFRVKC